MADRTTCRIRSTVSIVRHVETGWPTPRDIPIRYSADNVFGATGTAGFDGGENDTDEVYEDVLVLVAAAQVLDLTALTDPDGRAVSFAQIRGYRFVNLSTTDAVAVAPDGTDGWADAPTATLHPSTEDDNGDVLIEGEIAQKIPDATGGLVTSGSKRINFDPGAASADVSVLIFGLKV